VSQRSTSRRGSSAQDVTRRTGAYSDERALDPEQGIEQAALPRIRQTAQHDARESQRAHAALFPAARDFEGSLGALAQREELFERDVPRVALVEIEARLARRAQVGECFAERARPLVEAARDERGGGPAFLARAGGDEREGSWHSRDRSAR
jgi:hypothetical protein